MKYSTLLFDADETLYDFTSTESYALSHAFKEKGIGYHDKMFEDYKRINKQLWHEIEQGTMTQQVLRTERFSRLFSLYPDQNSCSAEDFSDCYVRHLSEGSFLIEGAAELIERLIEQQYRLAVITNGIKQVQMGRISRSVLQNSFEEIIISEDAGYSKPHTGIFDYAFERLKLVDKQEVLIIGDSLSSDILGGINYGIDTCWYNPNRVKNTTDIKPTHEVHSFEDLLSLLEEKTA